MVIAKDTTAHDGISLCDLVCGRSFLNNEKGHEIFLSKIMIALYSKKDIK